MYLADLQPPTEPKVTPHGDCTRQSLRGSFSAEERQEHIHILEFRAIRNTLQALKADIADTCVRLWCDNTTVVSCLNKGYSPKENIRQELRAIMRVLDEANASLVV